MTTYADMELQELIQAYNEAVEVAMELGVTLYKARTEFRDKEQAVLFLETIDSSIKAAKVSAAAVAEQKAERKSAKGQQNKGFALKKKNDKKAKKVLAKSRGGATLSPPQQATEAENQETEMATRKTTSKKSTTKARKGVAKSAKTRANGGTRTRYPDEARLTPGNGPEFREGTLRAKVAALVGKGTTVGAFREKGHKLVKGQIGSFLRDFVKNGTVKVGKTG